MVRVPSFLKFWFNNHKIYAVKSLCVFVSLLLSSNRQTSHKMSFIFWLFWFYLSFWFVWKKLMLFLKHLHLLLYVNHARVLSDNKCLCTCIIAFLFCFSYLKLIGIHKYIHFSYISTMCCSYIQKSVQSKSLDHKATNHNFIDNIYSKTRL